MYKYSLLQGLFLSFFSKDFYREVLTKRRGMGFKNLMFISFIASLIIVGYVWVLAFKFDTDNFSDELTVKMFEEQGLTFEDNLNRVLDIVSQIPKVTFEGDSISINEQEPYYIVDPISGKDLAIFDTTGYHTGLEDTDALMLFAKSKVITKKNDHTEEAVYVSEMTNEESKEKNLNVFFLVVSQLPMINIVNGSAYIEEETPYNIYDDQGNPIIVIDTSEDYEPIDNTNSFALITKDKIFFKDLISAEVGDDVVKEIYISDINEDVIYGILSDVTKRVRGFLLWFGPIFVLPILVLFSFAGTLISVLILAIITLILGKIVRLQGFEYEDALRVTSFAITPVFFLSKFVPDFFPNQALIYFLILVGYLYYSVYVNSYNNTSENMR